MSRIPLKLCEHPDSLLLLVLMTDITSDSLNLNTPDAEPLARSGVPGLAGAAREGATGLGAPAGKDVGGVDGNAEVPCITGGMKICSGEEKLEPEETLGEEQERGGGELVRVRSWKICGLEGLTPGSW
jgi:hypothetical protein